MTSNEWREKMKKEIWFFSEYGQGTGPKAQEVIAFIEKSRKDAAREALANSLDEIERLSVYGSLPHPHIEFSAGFREVILIASSIIREHIESL